MITFVFNVMNKHRGDEVTGQLEVLTGVKGSIEAASSSLRCPNHGAASSASILLRGADGEYELRILNSCCEAFRGAVELELTSGAGKSGSHIGL